MEFLFLLVGLAFFIYILNVIQSSDREDYHRQLNEQREFGYRRVKRQERKALNKKK